MTNIHEQICENLKVRQKIMSDKQLELLLRFTATHEYVLPCKVLSVIEASAIISSLINNPPPKRKRPYSYDRILQGFIDKYPDVYAEIMSRNL